jgi:uncharacterized integral membrane protein
VGRESKESDGLSLLPAAGLVGDPRSEGIGDVSATRSSAMSFSARQLAGAASLVVAVIFILQKRRSTTIRFLIPEVTAPLWVALLVSVLLGALAGGLLARKSH